MLRRLSSTPKPFNQQLLRFLVCPKTKTPLRYDVETHRLVSDEAKLAYAILDGIPDLRPDHATPLDDSRKTSGTCSAQ